MKQVIVVRKDLTMRKGKMACQVAHAAVMSLVNNPPEYNPRMKLWLETGMAKIVVSCENIDELFQIISKAKEMNVITSLIKDAGLTEVPSGTPTCCAIGPDEDHIIDEITGDLKLL